MTSEMCRSHVIAWLLAGRDIEVGDPEGRTKHMRMRPRSLALDSDETMLRLANEFWG
jgi:hypothetical protein